MREKAWRIHRKEAEVNRWTFQNSYCGSFSFNETINVGFPEGWSRNSVGWRARSVFRTLYSHWRPVWALRTLFWAAVQVQVLFISFPYYCGHLYSQRVSFRLNADTFVCSGVQLATCGLIWSCTVYAFIVCILLY